MSSEPPTKEIDLEDDERTDPHLRMPSAAPKPMAAMPKRALGATGSMPATAPVPRARSATPIPTAPSAAPPPLRPSARPAEPIFARPPILPTATRFGRAPTAPPPAGHATTSPAGAAAPIAPTTSPGVTAAPFAPIASTPPTTPIASTPIASPTPPTAAHAAPRPPSAPPTGHERPSLDGPSGPILATMLIPRPSSLPPALARATELGRSEPGGNDPLRERLALVEVQSAATRSIATRVESDTHRAHTRLDVLEPRVGGLESTLREAVTRLERASETARASLEMRVTEVELRAVPPASQISAPVSAPTSTPSASTELAELPPAMRTALATIRHELAEHERKFEARRARIESLESRLGILEVDARLVELRRMTESFDLRIAAIERDHANLMGELDRKVQAATSEVEARLLAKLAETSASREVPKEASKTKAPESELRKIKGVGPKYQKALAELGITTIRALAALTDADLARVATHLSMPIDKVKKLGWVEAARSLSSE